MPLYMVARQDGRFGLSHSQQTRRASSLQDAFVASMEAKGKAAVPFIGIRAHAYIQYIQQQQQQQRRRVMARNAPTTRRMDRPPPVPHPNVCMHVRMYACVCVCNVCRSGVALARGGRGGGMGKRGGGGGCGGGIGKGERKRRRVGAKGINGTEGLASHL